MTTTLLPKSSGINVRVPVHLDAIMLAFTTAVRNFFGVIVTIEQEKISREIIFRVLLRKRHTIDLSAARQVGKTEAVCFVVWFLSYVFKVIEREDFRCIITAPEKGTGSEVYDRTKKLFDTCEAHFPTQFLFKQKNLDAITTADDSRIDVFGLFKGFARREDKKTTKEGRSAHLVIRDEKHLGDDLIFRDELEPAMSTTGGVDVWIGNGGYRACRAKELSEMKGVGDVTVMRLDFDYMRAAMLLEHERTGNPMFLRWIESQEKYIADHGRESDEVRKNLFLEWIVEYGNFIDYPVLIGHRRAPGYSCGSTIADAGLDFGKEKDQTVLTITDYERNVRDWQVFRGEYEEQLSDIELYLPKRAAELGLSIGFLFCDSTGVGDPLKNSLRHRMRIPVRGVVFSPQHKDSLAKKMLSAFTAKEESKRLTYPANHEQTAKFEEQFRKLLRERRPSGLLNYRHPDENNAHDDFPDSLALSLWNIERMDAGAPLEA